MSPAVSIGLAIARIVGLELVLSVLSSISIRCFLGMHETWVNFDHDELFFRILVSAAATRTTNLDSLQRMRETKRFADGKHSAYSLATVAPSLTAWILKFVRGKCTRISLPSTSDLTLNTTSSRVSPTTRPWSRCLTPVSIGHISTSLPLLRLSGSCPSTFGSFSTKLASTMRFRAASPFRVVGFATAALAALTALLKRSCHAKILGYCFVENRCCGSAPFSPMSQSMIQIAVELH